MKEIPKMSSKNLFFVQYSSVRSKHCSKSSSQFCESFVDEFVYSPSESSLRPCVVTTRFLLPLILSFSLIKLPLSSDTIDGDGLLLTSSNLSLNLLFKISSSSCSSWVLGIVDRRSDRASTNLSFDVVCVGTLNLFTPSLFLTYPSSS